jgi:hypothetical protein
MRRPRNYHHNTRSGHRRAGERRRRRSAGLQEAISGIEVPQLSGLPDDQPSRIAFDREVLDVAATEIRHSVAQLLVDAVERRLPWEWPE